MKTFQLPRRTVLRSAIALAAAGLAAMHPAHLARAHTATDGRTWTHTFTGRAPVGIDQWEYVPFDVGPGASRISVTSSFDEFEVPGAVSNVLDLGMFGPEGWETGNSDGFRGWSGGARREFEISATEATPGYLAGPLEPGTWAVALGPVVVNPLGMGWEVTVTVDYGEPGDPFRPEPAPTRIAGRPAGWYRGDLHLHTVHSDGTRTPAELVAAARESGPGLHRLHGAQHALGEPHLGPTRAGGPPRYCR